MPLKGFDKGFTKSKVAQHIIKDGYSEGTLATEPYTMNISKQNIGMRSNTPAAVNPTSDLDENPRAGGAPQANGDSPMVPSSKGGASGDGPTPGYDGSGSGQATLNGAQQ